MCQAAAAESKSPPQLGHFACQSKNTNATCYGLVSPAPYRFDSSIPDCGPTIQSCSEKDLPCPDVGTCEEHDHSQQMNDPKARFGQYLCFGSAVADNNDDDHATDYCIGTVQGLTPPATTNKDNTSTTLLLSSSSSVLPALLAGGAVLLVVVCLICLGMRWYRRHKQMARYRAMTRNYDYFDLEFSSVLDEDYLNDADDDEGSVVEFEDIQEVEMS